MLRSIEDVITVANLYKLCVVFLLGNTDICLKCIVTVPYELQLFFNDKQTEFERLTDQL